MKNADLNHHYYIHQLLKTLNTLNYSNQYRIKCHIYLNMLRFMKLISIHSCISQYNNYKLFLFYFINLYTDLCIKLITINSKQKILNYALHHTFGIV